VSFPVPPLTRSLRSRKAIFAVAIIGIALAVMLGAMLRLVDPLSSPVVPAEDPYNHMALVQEHLRTGNLEPLYAGQTLYPPGLHGFMAAAVVLTGADLYDLVRFGPSLLGVIGIIGIAALLWRTAGPVAAFVGALAIAVAPEAIFRSTMLSPTALDLAILPVFLYALLRILGGRLGWAGVAAPTALFLALAHPWLVAILGAALFTFLVSAVVLPWRLSNGHSLSLMGAAACIAVLGAALGIAFTMPTFGFLLPFRNDINLVAMGLGIIALAFSPAVALILAHRRGWTRKTLEIRPAPWWARFVLSLAIAASLITVYVIALQQGMPDLVNLPRMIGWPILILAAAALVTLPFIASPIANMAASLVVVTLPFVLFNPLDSEFLSHRTVIFLGVALVLLAGITAGAVAHALVKVLMARQSASARAKRSPSRLMLLAAAPLLAVALLFGGSVYAGTPDAYDGGWYRLYNPCEMEALRDIAATADANPDALIITGDWQAKLVLASITTDASRVAYIGEFFFMEERRDTLVNQMEQEGRPIIVVTERYLSVETPSADQEFLSTPPWQPVGSWCANMGVPQPRVHAYTSGVLA
jgi:hypothetical protein